MVIQWNARAIRGRPKDIVRRISRSSAEGHESMAWHVGVCVRVDACELMIPTVGLNTPPDGLVDWSQTWVVVEGGAKQIKPQNPSHGRLRVSHG